MIPFSSQLYLDAETLSLFFDNNATLAINDKPLSLNDVARRHVEIAVSPLIVCNLGFVPGDPTRIADAQPS